MATFCMKSAKQFRKYDFKSFRMLLNLKTEVVIPSHRSFHGSCVVQKLLRHRPTYTRTLLTAKFLKSQKNNFGFSIVGVRCIASQQNSALPESVSDLLPEPPPLPVSSDPLPVSSDTVITDATNLVTGATGDSLRELGLGGYSPVGLLQHAIDWLHISTGLPWWGTIAIATVIVRCLMFPLIIKAQQNAAKTHNSMPQMQLFQEKLSQARRSGNQIEVALTTHQMMQFMKEKDINPFKNLLPVFVQMPVFISFFLGLRRMANVPMESFKDGGLWWFTNLTLPDPYYLLPLVTSVTLLVTLELGAETGARLETMKHMKYVLRALPIFLFPFVIKFPAAVLCYWVTSNAFTLCQVGVLRIPRVRQLFNIEKLVHINPKDLPVKKKGFVEGVKESFSNARMVSDIAERRRLDSVRFKKAGMGPVEKTYKHNPLKQRGASEEKN